MLGDGRCFTLSDTCMPLRLVNSVLFSVTLAVFITSAACNRPSPKSQPATSTDEWHQFQGTWIATGTRQSIPLGGTRKASITNFSGTMLLAGPSRPAVGFRAEAIVLNDSVTGLMAAPSGPMTGATRSTANSKVRETRPATNCPAVLSGALDDTPEPLDLMSSFGGSSSKQKVAPYRDSRRV